jgi:hypothetical protein
METLHTRYCKFEALDRARRVAARGFELVTITRLVLQTALRTGREAWSRVYG